MNITDVLRDAGISFCHAGEHHHVREGWVGIDCPWCPAPVGGKGKYRLGVELISGRVNCWVCGRHSLHQLIVTAGKVSHPQAKHLLKDIKLRRFKIHKNSEKVAGKVKLPNGIQDMQQAHRRYLREERKENDKRIEKLYDVKGIGVSHPIKWSLFIPIYLNGKIVSWTTRSISKTKQQRYITAKPDEEAVHIKDTLYGIDLVRNTIIVCEGPTDAWRVGPGAVATFGLNYTASQIRLIAKFPKRVICFDNTKEAQRVAKGLCSIVSEFPGSTVNVQLDAEDPGAASRDEIRKLRKAVM